MARRVKSQRRQNLGPFYLMASGLVVLMGVLIWMSIANTPSTASNPDNRSLPFPSIDRISVVDARKALDDQSAVFVDVRDAGSFNSGHIPGALNIYLSDFEARYSELNKNDWIILYCT